MRSATTQTMLGFLGLVALVIGLAVPGLAAPPANKPGNPAPPANNPGQPFGDIQATLGIITGSGG